MMGKFCCECGNYTLTIHDYCSRCRQDMELTMEKGSRVIVTARVESGYEADLKKFRKVDGKYQYILPGEIYYDPEQEEGITARDQDQVRKLFWFEEPHWEGLVIGWTTRRTGITRARVFRQVKDFKVWLVTPLNENRWVEPTACFARDLLLVSRMEPQTGAFVGEGEFPPLIPLDQE